MPAARLHLREVSSLGSLKQWKHRVVAWISPESPNSPELIDDASCQEVRLYRRLTVEAAQSKGFMLWTPWSIQASGFGERFREAKELKVCQA